jgi:ribosome-binding factor A
MTNQRQLRVGEEIRHAMADIFLRGEARDPGLRGVSITVTEVRVSPDLQNATAMVLPLGGADAEAGEALMAALGRAAPWMRSEISRRVKLRVAPRIVFRLDHSFEAVEAVERLLRQPAVSADLAGAKPGPDDKAE